MAGIEELQRQGIRRSRDIETWKASGEGRNGEPEKVHRAKNGLEKANWNLLLMLSE